MPKIIQLEEHPVGFTVEGGLPGEPIMVRTKEFSSSEDGNDFIARLEGISRIYAKAFESPPVRRSQVDTFLAVVKPNYETTVYINELELVAKAKIKRLNPGIAVGEPVYIDDIADIAEAELKGSDNEPIEIPAGCGITLILSHGWRKALYFDYTVLAPEGGPRTDNLARLFGHFISRLMFQELYAITEAQWERLIEWGWFPFVGLKHEDRKGLIAWTQNDRKPTSFLKDAAHRFLIDLDARIVGWEKYKHLKDRTAFFTRAKERLDATDYLSCINLIYPQIEGVMRSLFVEETVEGSPSQGTMSSNLVENQFEHLALLPKHFEQFIMRVYFRSFDQRAGNIPLSRHTVAHGISNPTDYDFLTSAVGFMVIDQLFYYLSD